MRYYISRIENATVKKRSQRSCDRATKDIALGRARDYASKKGLLEITYL
ncbi:MAG: hypothetical protein ACFB0B_04275 [Thermonemataceae bacterium]